MSSTLSNGSSLIPLLLHFPVASTSNLLPAKNLTSELLLPQRYGFLCSYYPCCLAAFKVEASMITKASADYGQCLKDTGHDRQQCLAEYKRGCNAACLRANDDKD
jgi:hypothetical protein